MLQALMTEAVGTVMVQEEGADLWILDLRIQEGLELEASFYESDTDPTSSGFCSRDISPNPTWSCQGLNLRLSACKAGASRLSCYGFVFF